MKSTLTRISQAILVLIATALVSKTCFATQGFLFTYDANGNRTTVTYFNNCRIKDTTQYPVDTVSVKAIKEIQSVNQPSVYPNPMHDFFILTFPNEVKEIAFIITDIKGSMIDRQKGIVTKNTIYDVSGFANGSYIVYITYVENEKEKSYTQKLIKE